MRMRNAALRLAEPDEDPEAVGGVGRCSVAFEAMVRGA